MARLASAARALALPLAALCLSALSWARPAPASGQIPGLDEWSGAVMGAMRGRWTGPRVEGPAPAPRPDAALTLRSALRPLSVHATEGVAPERVEEALAALEAAHDLLAQTGWGTPPPDGGRGGAGGFDLYLVPEAPRGASARADGTILHSFLDSESGFGVVDARASGRDLASCVTSAYAQTLLLGLDPAEAEAWRRATGSYLAWWITGELACDEDVAAGQSQTTRGWIMAQADADADARAQGAGALLLAMLSSRHDGGTGRYVRHLWQLARQRTWEGKPAGFRASPDLWEAVQVSVEQSDDDLEDMIEDFAVARFFVGDRTRERALSMPALAGLNEEARIEPLRRYAWADLPRRTAPMEQGVEAYGGGYFLVDVASAPPGAALRLWLRGEYGVRWSFVAIRLDAEGRELGRLRAPPRRRPDSYLLLDALGSTAAVLVVVTNLSSRIPDADEPDENVRSFQLIIDRGQGLAGVATDVAGADPTRAP